MKPVKIVVFDLDETLGYFVELSIFWESLKSYIKNEKLNYPLNQKEFNEILDLFEEFIRPNIIDILMYLKVKKKSNACDSVLIYTNNQGSKDWVFFIQKYFEEKIDYPLFDQVIGAFKINGKIVESCRTSNEKTIHDLLKCAKLPSNTEICFLDDLLYPHMSGKNIYYIKVNPYTYNLSFEVMIKRFFQSKTGKKVINNYNQFEEYMLKYMNNFSYIYSNKSKEEYEIDKIITKKTIYHLQTFFNKNWKNYQGKNQTAKKKRVPRNKTNKRR